MILRQIDSWLGTPRGMAFLLRLAILGAVLWAARTTCDVAAIRGVAEVYRSEAHDKIVHPETMESAP